MTEAGPLIAEYARQTAVVPFRLADALAKILAVDGTLPVPPAADRDTWDVSRGTADRPTRDDIMTRARDDLGTTWPQPLASAATRVHRDGDRYEWERSAFARQRRLSRAAVSAAVSLDDAWLDEVADGVWLLCEQSSWCWPAHDDSRIRHGSVLPVVADPFLDLGAGEVAGQLAWVDHLLGDELDARYPGLRQRMAHETRSRVLDPFRNRRDWHWLGLDGDVHNWNPWIHGNVLVAALRFLEPAERPATIALVIEGIERYVAALPDDGAIDEGYGYWWNGACRALEALDILRHATGGHLDAVVPALRATVAFPHRMQLGGPWFVDFADSQARPSAEQPWHALHRAAIQAGDDAARSFAASHRHPGAPAATEREGLGRLLRGMTDRAWLDTPPAAPPLPEEVWLPSTHVRIVRQRAGEAAGLTLAIKGGHNAEHHNHNDVGSVIVASDGVPVVADAGRPTYTATTFGPQRYAIWTMQSSWHSVPEIRGTAQGAGREFAATAAAPIDDGGRAGLELDLAGAYPVPGLQRWRRSATLDRAAARVVIDDAWHLEPWDEPEAEPPTTVRLLLAGAVELTPGAARVTPLDGATPVVIRWDADAEAALVVKPLDDPMLRDVWGESLSRLDIEVTTRARLRVTVELDPPIREMLDE